MQYGEEVAYDQYYCSKCKCGFDAKPFGDDDWFGGMDYDDYKP